MQHCISFLDSLGEGTWFFDDTWSRSSQQSRQCFSCRVWTKHLFLPLPHSWDHWTAGAGILEELACWVLKSACKYHSRSCWYRGKPGQSDASQHWKQGPLPKQRSRTVCVVSTFQYMQLLSWSPFLWMICGRNLSLVVTAISVLRNAEHFPDLSERVHHPTLLQAVFAQWWIGL